MLALEQYLIDNARNMIVSDVYRNNLHSVNAPLSSLTDGTAVTCSAKASFSSLSDGTAVTCSVNAHNDDGVEYFCYCHPASSADILVLTLKTGCCVSVI